MVMRPSCLDQGGGRAFGGGVSNKGMGIEAFAGHRDEEVAGLNGTGISFDPAELSIVRDLTLNAGAGRNQDFAEWNRPGTHAAPTSGRGNRSATRMIAERLRGFSACSVAVGRTAFPTLRSVGTVSQVQIGCSGGQMQLRARS